jgi:hypothetical protein
MEVVAEQELSALLPDRRVVSVHVRLGRPVRRSTGEWACPVEVDGLPGLQVSCEIFGEGSLQALTLGLRMLQSVLLDATVKGTVFHWPNSEDVVGAELLFWPDQNAFPQAAVNTAKRG